MTAPVEPAAARPRCGVGWLLIAVAAAADAALLPLARFAVVWRAELPVLAGSLTLALLWFVYGRLRPAPRLAELARIALQLLLYTNAAALLSYLLTALSPLPLLDGRLAALDRALGFDWLALYHWIKAAQLRLAVSWYAYFSLGPELLLLLLLLSPFGRIDRARELYLAFAVSSFAVILLGALLPAAGAFVEYQVPEMRQRAYVLQYLALRDGSLPSIELSQVQGLVQFPSFHAALAVLCAYALRGMRLLFPLGLLLNGLIIAVTPSIGGHHLVDVLGGLLLAAGTIALLPALGRIDQGR